MSVKKPNETDIFVVLRPLLYLEKACGFVFFKVKILKNGKKKLVHERWRCLLHVALQIVVMFYALMTLGDRCKYLEEYPGSFLSLVLHQASECATYASCLFFLIHENIYFNRKKQFWQKLYQIERNMRAVSITPLNYKLLRNVTFVYVIYTIVVALVVMGLLWLFVIDYLRTHSSVNTLTYFKQTASYLYYYYVHMSIYIIIFQYLCSFHIIKEMLEKLEKYIKDMVCDQSVSEIETNELLRISKYHQQVCEIAKETDCLMSIPMLTVYGQIFCLLIGHTYSSLMMIMKDVVMTSYIVKLVMLVANVIPVATSIIVANMCMKKVKT